MPTLHIRELVERVARGRCTKVLGYEPSLLYCYTDHNLE
jgi:hypothetical protein